jgi:hypothetical protein
MARKSKRANGAQEGQIGFDGEVVKDTHHDGDDNSDKAERGRGNSISYAERSAEWLRQQPQDEQERIALVLEKYRALQNMWARIYEYEQQTGCTVAEIMQLPECQSMMHRVYAEWEHVSLF